MTDKTSLSQYFSEVDGGNLLSKPEELELARIMDEGRWHDEEGNLNPNKLWDLSKDPSTLRKARKAREKLVESNLRLVAAVAKNYQNKGCELEDLIQEGNIGLMDGIDRFDHKKKLKISTYCCVPLSTQIFTKRGWKNYDQLIDGDETLGYNKSSGKTEWTKIKGIVTYKNAPLLRFGDSLWEAICTPNHKWLISHNGKTKLCPIEDWPSLQKYTWPIENKKTGKYERSKTHLITSAPFVGGNSDITPDEAALLAWVLSDGSMMGDYKNRDPQGAVIIQKNYIKEVKNLLERLEIPKEGSKHDNHGCLSFTVNAKFFRDLWKKAGLDKKTYSEFVLDLKPESRKAWLSAWELAEGTKGRKTIAQNEGEKLDALVLTKFLEGLPDIQVRLVDKNKEKCFRVMHHERWRTPRRCTVSYHGVGDVWCPKTELGTWTARSEKGSVFLTGNTWWIRQRIDRLISNHSRTVRVPVHVQTLSHKLKGMIESYVKEFNCMPSIPEISNALDCTHDMAKAALQTMGPNPTITLDHSPTGMEDSDESLHSYIEDENAASPLDLVSHQELVGVIKEVVKTLPERDEKILRLRFGIIEDPKDHEKWPITEEEVEELEKRKENG